MTESTIKLSDLARQADDVWARYPDSEVRGFRPSDYYDLIRERPDPLDFSEDPQNPDEELARLPEFNPLRANALRAFDWTIDSKVLEIGCGPGVTTSYLASQKLSIDALEPNRAMAQLAALRTRDSTTVRIVAESLLSLDFGSSRYDAIILSIGDEILKYQADNSEFTYSQAAAALLETCRSLLNDEGQIYLSIENDFALDRVFTAISQPNSVFTRLSDPAGYFSSGRFMNLHAWRTLLSGIFRQVDEYYLFPSVRYPRILLNRTFTSANPGVVQHLAWANIRTGFKSSARMINESLLHQIAAANGYLGELANGYLFVLSSASNSSDNRLDFAHLPDFERRPEFVSMVIKKSGDHETKRVKVNSGNLADQSGMVQKFEAETFHPGIALSVFWRNSLIADPRGIKFEQYLLTYFTYLKKLGSGVMAGMNIDAIANNIIVDAGGDYHLIDLEWEMTEETLKSEYVFYRAVMHFAIRNPSIFDDFRWINGLVTLGDFGIYCFKIIGINIGVGELELFRERDCRFQSRVMRHSRGYSLSDPLGVEVVKKTALCYLSWRYRNAHYQAHQKQVLRVSADSGNHLLKFSIPAARLDSGSERPLDCFRFFPFDHLQAPDAGFFAIDSLRVRAVADDHSSNDLLVLENSDQVSQANIHKGIFYGKKPDRHVYMFNNNDTFLEFQLPGYDPTGITYIEIDIDFRLSPSHDYETARYQYALAQREIDNLVEIKNEEIESLKEDLDDVTREYKQFKESRIWRLMIAYRDSFKISGYPKKNALQKLAHMIRLIRHPRSDDDR